MKIVINKIPPSNNKFIGNSKNFNIYRKEKELWHWLIKAAITKRPLQWCDYLKDDGLEDSEDG